MTFSVTRLRGVTTKDTLTKAPVTDWTTPDTVATDGWLFAPGTRMLPRTATTVEADRESITSKPVLYRAGIDDIPDVIAHDRIVFDGVTYDIDGDPVIWNDGQLGGLVVFLTTEAG